MSWLKTIPVKIKGQTVTVLLFFYSNAVVFDHSQSPRTEPEELELARVKVYSMVNEFILEEDILFTDRDAAYDFIEHATVSYAKAFLIRVGYDTGAFQN